MLHVSSASLVPLYSPNRSVTLSVVSHGWTYLRKFSFVLGKFS